MIPTNEAIFNAIWTDDSYKEESLQATYERIEDKEALNSFLISLCGYSWETLQEQRVEQ